MFICFICGHNGGCVRYFCDMVGNKIYICSSCLNDRIHRIEFKYGYMYGYIEKEDENNET